MVGVPQEQDGISLEALEAIHASLVAQGRRIRFLYVVPNFQNPTGLLIGLPKRKALLEWAARRDMLIVEDDPYRELFFEDSTTEAGGPADSRRRRRRAGDLSQQLLQDAGAGIPGRVDRCPGADRVEARDGQAGGGSADRQPRSADRLRSLPSRHPAAATADASPALPAQARRDGRRAARDVRRSTVVAVTTRRILPVGDAARPDRCGSAAGPRRRARGDLRRRRGLLRRRQRKNLVRLSFSAPTPERIREGVRRLGTAVAAELEAVTAAAAGIGTASPGKRRERLRLESAGPARGSAARRSTCCRGRR